MMRRLAGVAALMCASAFGATFEVASIKPHDGPTPRILDFSSSGPRLKLEAYTVFGLIAEAYHLKDYQIVYPQRDNTFYDIVAKSEGSDTLTRDQFRPLLQSLLADRFGLQFHRETKEMSVYALVATKGGARLKKSAPDAPEGDHFNGNGRGWQVIMPKGTMEDLADAIAGTAGLDRPVVDRTGLGGTYDIRFHFTTEDAITTNPRPTDLSVLDAVDSLGLKLEAQKAQIEVVVIDSVGKPSAN
jgi:uncharacterized protein (TIGR03435 family)